MAVAACARAQSGSSPAPSAAEPVTRAWRRVIVIGVSSLAVVDSLSSSPPTRYGAPRVQLSSPHADRLRLGESCRSRPRDSRCPSAPRACARRCAADRAGWRAARRRSRPAAPASWPSRPSGRRMSSKPAGLREVRIVEQVAGLVDRRERQLQPLQRRGELRGRPLPEDVGDLRDQPGALVDPPLVVAEPRIGEPVLLAEGPAERLQCSSPTMVTNSFVPSLVSNRS